MHVKRPIIILAAVIYFMTSGLFFVSAQEENSSTEAEEFDFANGLFSRGMYDMSINQYKDFLDKHPGSSYAELAYFRIAESYYLSELYDDAIKRFDEFLKKYPSSKVASKAVLKKGQAHYMKGDYKQAERIFNGILEGASDDEMMSAKYYLSNVYFRQGDREKAKRMLEDLLRGNANSRYTAFAYMNLGDIYTENKDDVNASRNYNLAIKYSDDEGLIEQAKFRAAGAFFRSGEYDEAYEFYKRITDGSASDDIFDKAAVGALSALHENKKFDIMVTTANDLLPRITNDEIKSQVLFIIGNRYFNSDNPEEAVKSYAQAFSLYPGIKFGLKAKLNECWALYRLGEYEKCLKSLDDYMKRTDESRDEALYIKARALSGLNRNEEAMVIYKVLEKDYEGSDFKKESIYDSGWLLDTSGDMTGAMERYKKFATKYPKDKRSPAVLLKYAQGALKLEQYDEAEGAYLDILSSYAQNPLKEKILYQLGKLYLDTSRHEEGIKIYERLLKEHPDTEARGVVLYGIGKGLQSGEKWPEAIDAFSRITYKDGAESYKRSKESIAYCFFRLNEHEKATNIYYDLITEDEGYILPEGVYRWTAEYYMKVDRNKKSLDIAEILLEKYPEADTSGGNHNIKLLIFMQS